MNLKKYFQLVEDTTPNSGVASLQTYLISHGFNKGYDQKSFDPTGIFTPNLYYAMLQFMKSNPNETDKNEFKKLALAIMDVNLSAQDSAIMQELDQDKIPAAVPNKTEPNGQKIPVSSDTTSNDASNNVASSANNATDNKTNASNNVASSANNNKDNKDKKTLAPRDEGTAKLQAWLIKQGYDKGFDGKPLKVDGRFGPNTMFASRKFLTTNPPPDLKNEYERLLNDVKHTMHVPAFTVKDINDATPSTPASQEYLRAEAERQQKNASQAARPAKESLERILKLARI